MNLELDGKLSLVSGSTAGIGHAIAAALAREGARVIVNGRSQAAVDNAVSNIESDTGAKVFGFAGDLSTDAAAHQLARQFPDVEILVNNLGIYEAKPFEDDPRRRLAALFRSERSQWCASFAPVSERHEIQELGPHHLYIQRKRCPDSD